MEEFDKLSLSPSEKLVAILDGELEKSEVGNFFQLLYQSADLQDEFFDVIKLKKEFGAIAYTPPSGLKSNILKGAGLIAASTLTYQTVATSNTSWFSHLWATLGTKVSLVAISATFASILTFGVTKHYQENRDISNANNSNKAIVEPKSSNNRQDFEQGKQPQNLDKKGANLFIVEKETEKRVATIKQSALNSKNRGSDINKVEMKGNNDITSGNVEDKLTFSKQSLIPGTVPLSSYKVEYLHKNESSNSLSSSSDKVNKTDRASELSLSDNLSDKEQSQVVENEKTNSAEFITDGFNISEVNKGKYIDEESRLSLHFRNFSSKNVNNISVPQMESPIINNIAASIFYQVSDNLFLGVELGQENFQQEFKAKNGDYQINVQQNYLAFWGGGNIRYKFKKLSDKITNIQPYTNLFIGSTDRGPLVKPSAGLVYLVSNDFSIFAGVEYSVLYTKYDTVWYNSQKYGLTYGFIIKL